MMSLQTLVNIPDYTRKILYQDPIMMVGSCFSENIGAQLADMKYQAMINPFGVMYNPVSVKQTLEIIMEKRKFTKQDLRYANHLWFSYHHHTSFSKADEKDILELINNTIEKANDHLKKSNFLFITFGTARVYVLKENGEIVANCHKQPQKLFDHKLLRVEKIVESYDTFIAQIQEKYPKLNLIFTISPVRHWKDGAVGNQVSKSTLILAIQQLIERHQQCYYFPSYEIFMDELRDYRFYSDDMLHPSSIGKEYIWQRFKETFLEEKEHSIRKTIEKINRAFNHKPYFPDSEEYKKFAQSTLKDIQNLTQAYPHLDLQKEIAFFQSIIEK